MIEKSKEYKKQYGAWRGSPPDYTNCAQEIPDHNNWIHNQCSRPRGYGPDQAYCKQHAEVKEMNRYDAYLHGYVVACCNMIQHCDGDPMFISLVTDLMFFYQPIFTQHDLDGLGLSEDNLEAIKKMKLSIPRGMIPKSKEYKEWYGIWSKRPGGNLLYHPNYTLCAQEINVHEWWTKQCEHKRGYGSDLAYCKQHAEKMK